MAIKDMKKHVDCGGYWLKKFLPNNVDFRCTKCGNWKSNEDKKIISR